MKIKIAALAAAIDKVTAEDDRFTAPACTVTFANGIELLLSASAATFSGMERTEVKIGNRGYSVFSNSQEKVYQYRAGKLCYSYRMKTGQNEELIMNYLAEGGENG